MYHQGSDVFFAYSVGQMGQKSIWPTLIFTHLDINCLYIAVLQQDFWKVDMTLKNNPFLSALLRKNAPISRIIEVLASTSAHKHLDLPPFLPRWGTEDSALLSRSWQLPKKYCLILVLAFYRQTLVLSIESVSWILWWVYFNLTRKHRDPILYIAIRTKYIKKQNRAVLYVV